MANEVIIEEYSDIGTKTTAKGVAQIPGTLVTTQVLSIATASAALDATTSFVRIQSKGTGFWYKVGSASVDAVANTALNRWLPADQFRDVYINPGVDVKIDTAA